MNPLLSARAQDPHTMLRQECEPPRSGSQYNLIQQVTKPHLYAAPKFLS